MTTPMRRTTSPRRKAVVVAVIGYLIARALLAAAGLHRYNMFRDPFDLGKLLIDVALWTALYVGATWLFTRRG